MTRQEKQTNLYSLEAIAHLEGVNTASLHNISAKHRRAGDKLFNWRGWTIIEDGKKQWRGHKHTYPVVIHSIEDVKDSE